MNLFQSNSLYSQAWARGAAAQGPHKKGCPPQMKDPMQRQTPIMGPPDKKASTQSELVSIKDKQGDHLIPRCKGIAT
jgi:hypothetical protein